MTRLQKLRDYEAYTEMMMAKALRNGMQQAEARVWAQDQLAQQQALSRERLEAHKAKRAEERKRLREAR